MEPRHPRLGVDIPNQPIKPNGLQRRRVLLHFFVIVFGILVIPHPHELLLFVATRENESSDTENVFWGDFGWVGSRALELECVDSDGNGTNETVIEFLVKLFVSGRRDVDETPLKIYVGYKMVTRDALALKRKNIPSGSWAIHSNVTRK